MKVLSSMKTLGLALVVASVMGAVAPARADDSFAAVPFQFDPSHINPVSAEWVHGLGVPPPATPPVDTNDPKNDGLLLGKSEPTTDNASSGARLVGLKNNL